jgi:hypothetical protein
MKRSLVTFAAILILTIPMFCFGQINIMDFGAKGDGVADDTEAFQKAFNNAIAAKTKLVIPPPKNFYKITNTIQVIPAEGKKQALVDVDAWGWGANTNCIMYMGQSHRPVFRILGLKQAVWTGLKVAINDGLTGVQIFDIDTTPDIQSTSFVTFKNFYLNLGNKPNNDGFRLGHLSGGSADVSNYQWENCVVFGNRLPGQIAYHISGQNTLSNTWMGGFVAFCDKIFSNKAGPGAKADRGNGSVYFYGLGGSQNNTDFEFAFEQTYVIIGGRFEAGGRFLNVIDHRFHASISVIGVQISAYEPHDGVLMYMGTAGSLTVENCNMYRNGGDFSNMIVLGGTGAKGSLIVRGGAASSAKPFYKKVGNATEWKVYIQGVGKFSLPNGVYSTDMFDDEQPPLKGD